MPLGTSVFSPARWVLLAVVSCAAAQPVPPDYPCSQAQKVPPELKIPANLPVKGEPFDFEKQVRAYFGTLAYRNLGWC